MGYADFDDHRWAWNSGVKPWKLWQVFPKLLHIDKRGFMPIYKDWELLWSEENKFDWSENYAVHIYNKKARKNVNDNLQELMLANNTVGDLTRFVLNTRNIKN